MTLGSIVLYTERENEPGFPAIVTQVWPEGTLRLHVFHPEATAHVRAAHPSQIKLLIDSDQIDSMFLDQTSIIFRLNQIGSKLDELWDKLEPSTTPHDNELLPLELKNTTVSSDEAVTPEPDEAETVESTRGSDTRKNRKAWPR